MILSIASMFLPIVAGLLIGMTAKKRGWVGRDGAELFKKVVSTVLLPVVVMDAFISVQYSGRTVFICVCYFCATIVGLGIGFLLRRFTRQHARYLPFLMTASEFGMFGYPLIRMICPETGMNWIAMIDFGNTVFFFGIMAPLMRVSDGERFDIKELLKKIFTGIPFDFMLIGLIIGVTGLGDLLAGTVVAELYRALVDFMNAPLMMMILVYLGTELSFRKELMGAVVRTYLMRQAVMALLGTICIFVVLHFVPFDKSLICALILAFILPPAYGVPIFGNPGEDRDFVCTMISFSSLMTLILFVGLAVYATM